MFLPGVVLVEGEGSTGPNSQHRDLLDVLLPHLSSLNSTFFVTDLDMASCGAHGFLSNRYLYLPGMKIIFLNLKLNFHSLLIRKNTHNIGKISEEIVVSYKCLLSVDCTYYTYCACVHTSVAVQCAWTFTTHVLTFSYTMFTIVHKGECVSVHTYTQCVEIKCGSQGRDCSCKYPDSASFWQP